MVTCDPVGRQEEDRVGAVIEQISHYDGFIEGLGDPDAGGRTVR